MELKELFNYGLPTVLVFVGVYALGRVAVWCRANIVEPLVKSHLELVGTLRTAITQNTNDLADSKRLTSEVKVAAASATAKTIDKLDRIEKALVSQTEILESAIKYQTQTIEDQDGKRPATPPRLPPAS